MLCACLAGDDAVVSRPAAAAAAAAAAADPCASLVDVQAIPAAPRAGTLFRLRMVRADSAIRVAASVAREPLHFEARGDTLEGLAAVPVDSASGIDVRLTCGQTGMDTASARVVRIGTTAGNYRLEQLSVAPRYSAPVDSALAARMQREAERAAAVSRTAHATPRLWHQPFVAPRESRITSGFGNGRTFNGEVTSRHTGTDYAGSVGAPVRAVNRGVVRIVDTFYLGGNVVYLDHGAGIVTAYLHLDRATVAIGDTVARGQVIGRVGATGRVTGPHLHLIARYGGISVDATTLIGRP